MTRKWSFTFTVVFITGALAAIVPAAAQQKDLTYNAITPCYVVNTYKAGGAFAAGETRVYNVVGSGSFASQGGSASGCGIPGFSNGIARVQAVALDVAVSNPAGTGHIWAVAADAVIDPLNTPGFLAFPGPTGTCCVQISNTGPVAVRQSPNGGDIKIKVAAVSANIVVSVVGYYTRFGETILVGPESTPAASGTALLNALTSIADNSASKPYLIKLEPGVYDLGDNRLQMKPFVDIEGSGRGVTIVQGAGNSDGVVNTGVVRGADSAELRNLTLKGLGSGSRPYVIPMYNESASPSVRDVAIVSSGGTVQWGIRNANGNPTVEDVSILVTGSTLAVSYGISNNGPSSPKVRRTEISVTNPRDAVGIYWDGLNVTAELREVRVDATGANNAYGVLQEGFDGLMLTVEDSTINARNASNTYGIRMSGGNLFVSQSKIRGLGPGGYGIYSPGGGLTATVGHSEIVGDLGTVAVFSTQIGATLLDGGPVVAGIDTCAGVYDESYTFYASTCP